MTTFRFDPVAFREQVLNADWMVAEMASRAERGLAFAEGIAPRRTGRYADSFGVQAGKDGGWSGDRAYGLLYNDSDHAVLVEYVDHHFVLHRSLDAMGGGGGVAMLGRGIRDAGFDGGSGQ